MLSFFTGGLRPAGPPYTLARGDPYDPRSARVAHALVARSPSCFLSLPGGFAPPDPPTRSLAGSPMIPAPLAWLTRWSLVRLHAFFLYRGASPRRTPLHARSRGPYDPRSARVAPALGARSPSCLPSLPGGFAPPRPPPPPPPGAPSTP